MQQFFQGIGTKSARKRRYDKHPDPNANKYSESEQFVCQDFDQKIHFKRNH
jgi:hypothetical protein